MTAKKSGSSGKGKSAYKKPVKGAAPSGFLTKYKGDLVAIAAIYLLIVIFFAPVVFQGMGLAPAADMIASAGMYEMGEDAVRHFRFPLWNPTLFSGLPMFASLQYAFFYMAYLPEYVIRPLSLIFDIGDLGPFMWLPIGEYRIWLFYFLLAGIFMYLLARHYGCGRLTSWLAGTAYAFSPQLIVLAEVGHGSKLMGMTFLPLIWLMLDRLRIKPSVGRAAALGAVFAVEILALHPQVAAYGALMMAIYLIYYGVSFLIRKKFDLFGKLMLFWGGAMALALALSAVLWVSVLDFSRFTIRGASDAGVAGGGLDWSYATGWSFHPLESITFLFPRFMGFGGQTYWGTVGTPMGQPFTHNPMYFGCGILLLSLLALVILPKRKWGFPLALGLTAWVLSFGKYLPILYGTLFHVLPLFNKFRAPVMGQVLLLLPAALLAGMCLEEIIRRVRDGDKSENLQKVLLWIAGVSAFVAIVVLIGEGLFGSIYRSFALGLMPDTQGRLLEMAKDMARPDVARVMGLVVLMTGASYLGLKRKVKWQVPAVIFAVVLLVDLLPVNHKLVSFTPRSYVVNLFKPEAVVRKLSKDQDKFRIHPLDSRYRAANWWSYFGLESTTGYFGAKMANYQKLMTAAGLERWGALFSRPRLLDALNVRYIISSYPLDAIFAELRKQGRGDPVRAAREFTPVLMPRDPRGGSGAFVYRNPGELPRVRLVGEYRVIEEFDPTLKEMLTGDWNPAVMTLLDREPGIKPQPGGGGEAKLVDYRNEKIRIRVNTDSPKLLVLADSYYPSGWKALVDGQETDIMRADGVLRAIALPAGSHDVEFVFKPKWFYVGLWVSVISLVGLIGLGVYLLFGRRSIP